MATAVSLMACGRSSLDLGAEIGSRTGGTTQAGGSGGAMQAGGSGQSGAGDGSAGTGGFSVGGCVGVPSEGEKLASTLIFPGTVALSDSDVFWVEDSDIFWNKDVTPGGAVWRLPKEGGTPFRLAMGIHPVDLVVAAGTPYWAESYASTDPGGFVKNVAGQIAECEGVTGLGIPLAVDSQNLYWQCNGNGDIYGEPLAGGDSVTLPPPLSGFGCVALASDGVTFYALEEYGGIWATPIDGGSLFGLSSGSDGFGSLVVDGVAAFSIQGSTLVRATELGDPALLTLVDPPGAPGAPDWSIGHSLAMDATNLYWLNDHELMTIPKTGGTATVVTMLPCDDGNPNHRGGIAVDDANIYWAAYGGVWRIAKP